MSSYLPFSVCQKYRSLALAGTDEWLARELIYNRTGTCVTKKKYIKYISAPTSRDAILEKRDFVNGAANSWHVF